MGSQLTGIENASTSTPGVTGSGVYARRRAWRGGFLTQSNDSLGCRTQAGALPVAPPLLSVALTFFDLIHNRRHGLISYHKRSWMRWHSVQDGNTLEKCTRTRFSQRIRVWGFGLLAAASRIACPDSLCRSCTAASLLHPVYALHTSCPCQPRPLHRPRPLR